MVARKNKFQQILMQKIFIVGFALFATFIFSGCGIIDYTSYVLFGSSESKVKARYEGLANKKVLILLNTQAGIEYSYPQTRINLILACQKILNANIETISFCDHEAVENFIMRELDWISMPTSTLAKRFGAERVVYVDLYKFTLQDSDSIGIYQGQVSCDVKIYETESQSPNKPVKNFSFNLKYPENHPVAATPENKYLVLEGTIKQTSYEICKNFFDYKQRQ